MFPFFAVALGVTVAGAVVLSALDKSRRYMAKQVVSGNVMVLSLEDGRVSVMTPGGEALQGITGVHCVWEDGQAPRCVIQIADIECVWQGKPVYRTVDPRTGYLRDVKRIEYANDHEPFEPDMEEETNG